MFEGFYFGGDPAGDPGQWRGFIGDEPLLVQQAFFAALEAAGLAYGFVSGAEPPPAVTCWKPAWGSPIRP